MFKAVRAVAFLRGREFVTPGDIASIIKELDASPSCPLV